MEGRHPAAGPSRRRVAVAPSRWSRFSSSTSCSPARPAPRTPGPAARPGHGAAADHPLGADENLRARTLAEVAAAKKALSAAQRAENQTRQKAADLDKALAGFEGQRAALAGEERAAADRLEGTRSRLRTAAVSEYISGGKTTIANQLLRSVSLEEFTRNRVYGAAVLQSQQRTLATYRDQLSKVTAVTSTLGRQVDRAKADRGLILQELEALVAQRALREQELAQKQILNQLATAGAPVLPSDIPALVLDAYVRGAAAANRRTPGCRIHWSALAAIGRTESGHARSGGASLTLTGDVTPRILGPRLDGNGFAYVGDTDGGPSTATSSWTGRWGRCSSSRPPGRGSARTATATGTGTRTTSTTRPRPPACTCAAPARHSTSTRTSTTPHSATTAAPRTRRSSSARRASTST